MLNTSNSDNRNQEENHGNPRVCQVIDRRHKGGTHRELTRIKMFWWKDQKSSPSTWPTSNQVNPHKRRANTSNLVLQLRFLACDHIRLLFLRRCVLIQLPLKGIQNVIPMGYPSWLCWGLTSTTTKCKLHANPLQKALMRSGALGGKIWSAPVRNHGLKMNFIGPFFCSKFLHRNIILCIFGPDSGPELFVMHFPVPESWENWGKSFSCSVIETTLVINL